MKKRLPIKIMIQAPANGRVGKSTVLACDRQTEKTLHTDRGDLGDAAVRAKLAKKMAGKLDVDPLAFGERLDRAWNRSQDAHRQAEKEAAERRVTQEAEGEALPETVDERAKRLLAEMPKAVRIKARAMLRDPNLLDLISADIEALGVAGERKLRVLLYLTGTSRLLDKPVATLVQGPTSSGKSHTIDRVAELFPDEAVLRATSLTANALYYLKPDRLPHCWVVAGERSRKEDDSTAEATRALREMLSSGRLVKATPRKDDHGNLVTEEIVQQGPIAFVESTTRDLVFDEDANRMISVYTNEQPVQTRRVIDMEARRRAGHEPIDTEPIVRWHHAMQRLLRCREVVIPFAQRLAELMPDRRVEARRVFSHLLNVIAASALLHQYQRDRDDDGRVLATDADYAVARDLLLEPLGRRLGDELPKAAVRFYERLKKWKAHGVAKEQFTTTEARIREKVSKQAVSGWLPLLEKAGWVKVVERGRGREPAIYRLVKGANTKGPVALLPLVADVCSLHEKSTCR
jgi:hypothetical protein